MAWLILLSLGQRPNPQFGPGCGLEVSQDLRPFLAQRLPRHYVRVFFMVMDGIDRPVEGSQDRLAGFLGLRAFGHQGHPGTSCACGPGKSIDLLCWHP